MPWEQDQVWGARLGGTGGCGPDAAAVQWLVVCGFSDLSHIGIGEAQTVGVLWAPTGQRNPSGLVSGPAHNTLGVGGWRARVIGRVGGGQ